MRMRRREFIKYTAAAAGSYAISSFNPLLAVEQQKKYANDVVTLGKTGIKVSSLAMGTGTNGYNYRSNQTRKLGIEGVADLLKAADDQGINFWDSADINTDPIHTSKRRSSTYRAIKLLF